MSEAKKGRVPVQIGQTNVITVVRDIVHQRGKATVAVHEIEAAGVGGDVDNAVSRSKRRRRSDGKKRTVRAAAKAITHGIAAIISVPAMVMASGICALIGWA